MTPPTGTTGTNTYTIYKIFGATQSGSNISYNWPYGDTITYPTAKYVETSEGSGVYDATQFTLGNYFKLENGNITEITGTDAFDGTVYLLPEVRPEFYGGYFRLCWRLHFRF